MLSCRVVSRAGNSCSLSSRVPRAKAPKQWHACASKLHTAESSPSAKYTPGPGVLAHLRSSNQAGAERAFAPADRTRVCARYKTGAERASKRARTSIEVLATQKPSPKLWRCLVRQVTTPQELSAERCSVPSVYLLPLRRWQQRPHTRLNALTITLVPLWLLLPWIPPVDPRRTGWQIKVSIGVRRQGPLGSKQSRAFQSGMPMRQVSRLPPLSRREGRPLTSPLIGLTLCL